MENILEYIKLNSKVDAGLLSTLDEKLERLTFPTRKNEGWRYYPVSKMKFSEKADPESNELLTKLVKEHRVEGLCLLVFWNGVFKESLSDSHEFFNLVKADDINFSEEAMESAVDLISVYSASSGYDIFVEGESKSIQVLNISSEKTSYSKNRIVLAKNASAMIMESFVLVGESLHSTHNEISLGESAELEYVSNAVLDEPSQLLVNQNISAYESSKLNSLVLDTDAGKTRRRSNVNLLGEKSFVDFKGFYLTNKKAVVNHKLDINHLVPNCISKQLYKGILDGDSKVIFDGKVYVEKGAMGTDSEQLNKSMLFSNTAEVDTKPQLEIYADDVVCAHGATLGGFNPDEVFYLQSRAIPQEKAVEMLCYGYAEDVFQAIENENIHSKITSQFLNRFRDYEVDLNEL